MELRAFAERYGLAYDTTGKVDMSKTVQAAVDFAALEARVQALEESASRCSCCSAMPLEPLEDEATAPTESRR